MSPSPDGSKITYAVKKTERETTWEQGKNCYRPPAQERPDTSCYSQQAAGSRIKKLKAPHLFHGYLHNLKHTYAKRS